MSGAAGSAVLFVLLPPGSTADLVLGDLTELPTRYYPPAADGAHLLSLVRAARDPTATRWLRGMLTAILAGTFLGLATNAVLAIAFDMFGGLLEIALPLGFFVGGFLGGFTAAMTGTHAAIPEVRRLSAHVEPGMTLLQIEAPDAGTLDELLAKCAAQNLHYERPPPR